MTSVIQKCLTCFTVAVLSVGGSAAARAEPTDVSILLDWFAQATHGGYVQAEVQNLGAEDNIAIKILDGGPRIQTIPQVASGQAQFGVGYADAVLLARSRGAPVRAVFVHSDYVPYTLVYHPHPGISSLSDLKDRRFAVALGSPYWEWVKKTFGLSGVQEVPVTGDLTLFRSDTNLVQQGLSNFLPARMQKAGIDFEQFKVNELGYKPYYVLFTTEEMIAREPETVRAAIKAVKEGWIRFAEDPQTVKPILMERNSQIEPDIHDIAANDMIVNMLPAARDQIGCMEDGRWSDLAAQLAEAGLLPADFAVQDAYDTSFVPGCRGR